MGHKGWDDSVQRWTSLSDIKYGPRLTLLPPEMGQVFCDSPRKDLWTADETRLRPGILDTGRSSLLAVGRPEYGHTRANFIRHGLWCNRVQRFFGPYPRVEPYSGARFQHKPRSAQSSASNANRRVCKRWLRVAQDIPRFWRTIAIDPSKPTLSFEAVSSWLARSKNLPKAVHISARLCGKEVPYGYGTRKLCRGEACYFSGPVLVKVLKDGPLLDAVPIDCPSPECFQQLSDSFGRFNNHHKPSGWDTANNITIFAKWEDQWVNLPPSTWLFLPQLTGSLQLTLPTIYFASNATREPLAIDIPAAVLQRLTTLKLTCDWSADHVLKLLHECKSLEVLSFDMCFGRFSSWNSGDTFMQGIAQSGVALPALRTLSLRGVNTYHARDLVMIKQPAVRVLSVMFDYDYWVLDQRTFPAPPSTLNVMNPQDGISFASFLRGSTQSPSLLESLAITNGIFQEDTLYNALKDLVSLRHLKLDQAVFNVDTFSKLLPPPPSNPRIVPASPGFESDPRNS
ncbi:hypothetical protein FA13DRAFT_1704241 [Coprinellus micaceus]|uniref:F-box domain-containing protein n=1 Tax=Coprinellus micaceus TaxID=71717 RepID=A0A4Y7U163_COPMI|nr:hypothetical protein FA13DRAFT_1704241 [Coprinellus micaceus]